MSNPRNHSRRTFLKGILGAGALGAAATTLSAAPLHFLRPMQIDNPLAAYPNRDWESTYRNIFAHDSSFVFLCAPNDTHNCLLRAYVKNDVAVRIGPTFGYGKAQDLYGNTASHRWDPRLCQKGLALVRRVYGDRRVKSPMIRRGFKEWADAGFPRDPDTGRPDPKYFQRQGQLRATWDGPTATAPRRSTRSPAPTRGEAGAKRSPPRATTRHDRAMRRACRRSSSAEACLCSGPPGSSA
jgi:nitrate reductase alpha subunit